MTGKDLDDFGEDLAKIRADTRMEWAAVDSARPMTREAAHTDVGPGDPGAFDEGIRITFHLASGRVIDEWYRKPAEWDIANDLVLLLTYWDLHPGDLDKLNGDDVFEIPVEYDEGVGNFVPNWPEIERTIHTSELEAQDDD